MKSFNRNLFIKILSLVVFIGSFIVGAALMGACGKINKTSYIIYYYATSGGKIVGKNVQRVEWGNETQEVTAIADDGYYFVEWSDGVTTSARQDKNITENKTVTAIFEKIIYKLIYAADIGGKIDGQTQQTITANQSGTTVIAVPDMDYKFVQWSDGVTEATRQDKNITENKTVTAIFEKIKFAVTYKVEEGGLIEGNAEQEVEYGKNAASVKAVADIGYSFVKWSDGITMPERYDCNILADKTVTAVFEKLTFTIKYVSDEDNIEIETESGQQYAGSYVILKVNYGESSDGIKSVKPYNVNKYVFIRWEDGIETEERQELFVTCDMTIKVRFGFELMYKVEDAKGGKIIGDICQKLEVEAESQPVKAVANDGYVFCGWSDLEMSPIHQTNNLTKHLEYVAYFEPIAKTFKYEYGVDAIAPFITSVTLNRYALDEVKFQIPQKSGFLFRGWYADDCYKLKVATENGKLMLGYQTLNLETDTLYAKWEKIGETIKTYKILMIMVDEVNAKLHSSESNEDILVNYKMSGIERKFCSIVPSRFSLYLNKWFDGKVLFEIDTYFTREVITKEKFTRGIDFNHQVTYGLCGTEISEIADIINEYECTIVTYGMNDSKGLLHFSAGAGGPKHAYVNIESCILYQDTYMNLKVINTLHNDNGNGEINVYSSGYILIVYFHEFTHTIEQRYRYPLLPEFSKYTEEVYEFHKYDAPNSLEGIRLYLLKQAIMDGQAVGIPPSYWEDFYN